MNPVQKVTIYKKYKKIYEKKKCLDNLNIENVFMGLVRNILVNMPLERPPDSGDASTSLKELDAPVNTAGGCPC